MLSRVCAIKEIATGIGRLHRLNWMDMDIGKSAAVRILCSIYGIVKEESSPFAKVRAGARNGSLILNFCAQKRN